MDDYIRRDIVLEIINTVDDKNGFARYEDYCVLFDEIDTMPAADVQPVKRGEWAAYNRDCRGYADCFKCSCCENYVHVYCWQKQCDYDYCPHCGARMDGDTE